MMAYVILQSLRFVKELYLLFLDVPFTSLRPQLSAPPPMFRFDARVVIAAIGVCFRFELAT